MGSCKSMATCIVNCAATWLGTINNLHMFNSFHFSVLQRTKAGKKTTSPLLSFLPWHKCGQKLLLWFWQHHNFINEIQVHKAVSVHYTWYMYNAPSVHKIWCVLVNVTGGKHAPNHPSPLPHLKSLPTRPYEISTWKWMAINIPVYRLKLTFDLKNSNAVLAFKKNSTHSHQNQLKTPGQWT